jgi:hypothetical protein
MELVPNLSRRTFTAGLAGIAAASVVSVRGTRAQDASPEAGGPGLPPIPEGATVVADGLWNPTNLLFGEDGALYIAESGVSGGGEPDAGGIATPNAEGTPFPGPAMLIPGQVSKLAADGTLSVLGGGLGSAVGLGIWESKLYVSAGGGSIGSGFAEAPGENTISSIDLASGEVATVASLGSYEAANNPDGTDVNPNLYGIAFDADGLLYVNDAGGNTIYTVDVTSGDFSLFTVVPNLETLTGATPVPVEQSRQPVPTGIVIDADGMIHVSLLSEAWSGPSLLTYTPDGEYTAGPGPLAAVVSITIGPDGLLYATQLSDNLEQAEPAPGSIKRIAADGTVETVVEGLFFPHGIAFDADGALYVTVNSIISGPDAPLGQVIKLDGIATPAM